MSLRTDLVVAVETPLVSGEREIGTGYVIGPKLVLTAGHVVKPAGAEPVGPPHVHLLGLPSRSTPTSGTVVWLGQGELDAALLELGEEIAPDVDPLALLDPNVPRAGLDWHARGAPRVLPEARTKLALVSFQGRTAAEPPDATRIKLEASIAPQLWNGMSGASAFVLGRLAAVIVDRVPGYTDGRLLEAVTTRALLADPGFRACVLAARPDRALADVQADVVEVLARWPRVRSDLGSILRCQTPVTDDRVATALLSDRHAIEVVSKLHAADLRLPLTPDFAPPESPGPIVELLDICLPQCSDWFHVAHALAAQSEADPDCREILVALGVTGLLIELVLAAAWKRRPALEIVRGQPRGKAVVPDYLESGPDPDGGQRFADMVEHLRRDHDLPQPRDASQIAELLAAIRGRLRARRRDTSRPRPYLTTRGDARDAALVERVLEELRPLPVVQVSGDPADIERDNEIAHFICEILRRDAQRRASP